GNLPMRSMVAGTDRDPRNFRVSLPLRPRHVPAPAPQPVAGAVVLDQNFLVLLVKGPRRGWCVLAGAGLGGSLRLGGGDLLLGRVRVEFAQRRLQRTGLGLVVLPWRHRAPPAASAGSAAAAFLCAHSLGRRWAGRVKSAASG